MTAYLALIPVCAGVFIAADDQTAIVTVLPRVMLDMKVPPTELDRASWTITGYLLGYVAAMPFLGRVSDVYGHRRLFVLSMLLFMGGSAAVAVAPDLRWLVAARVFQAVGAGALVPIAIAIVGDLLPPERRGVALGIVGASAEAGGVIGPLWAGIIVRYLSWRWVFWINIPLGVVVLAPLGLLLGASPRHRAALDFLGGALLALSLATLTLGLARVGGPDPLMALYLAAALASLLLFVLRQARAADPLVPISMFAARAFGAASATHLLVGGALIIGMVTVPLMANTVMGLTPLDGGLRLMRLTAAIPVGALVGGLACQRLDYRVPTAAGMALAALGFAFMGRWDAAVAEPASTVHLVLAGLGFGLVIAPIALAATNSVAARDRGTAAALITATRIVGMTVGLAALTAWGTDNFQGLVAGMQLPQTEAAALEFERRLIDAGVTVFQDFFRAAMGVSLAALAVGMMMAWGPGRSAPDVATDPAGGSPGGSQAGA